MASGIDISGLVPDFPSEQSPDFEFVPSRGHPVEELPQDFEAMFPRESVNVLPDLDRRDLSSEPVWQVVNTFEERRGRVAEFPAPAPATPALLEVRHRVRTPMAIAAVMMIGFGGFAWQRWPRSSGNVEQAASVAPVVSPSSQISLSTSGRAIPSPPVSPPPTSRSPLAASVSPIASASAAPARETIAVSQPLSFDRSQMALTPTAEATTVVPAATNIVLPPPPTPPPSAPAAESKPADIKPPAPLAEVKPPEMQPPDPTPVETPEARADASVRRLLNDYRAAYNRLDASTVESIWPTVNGKAIERAFDQLDEQDLQFDSCTVTPRGDVGSAVCVGKASYVPRVGNRTARVEPRRWTFQLKQTNGVWVIASVVSGPR